MRTTFGFAARLSRRELAPATSSARFRTDISSRSLECDAGYAWTEPIAERHANYVGALGAHVLVIQPDPSRAELLEPLPLAGLSIVNPSMTTSFTPDSI